MLTRCASPSITAGKLSCCLKFCCLFNLIIYISSTIFQLLRVEQYLARFNVFCSRTQAVTPVRLETAV